VPGLRMTSLEMRNFPDPLTFWRLVRHLRRGQYTILHTFLYQADILGRLAGKAARVPIIVSSLRCSYRWLKPWHHRVDRWTSYLTDRITAVSEATRLFAIREEGIRPELVVTLRNGINLERFCSVFKESARRLIRSELSIPEDTIVLTIIGRLHPQKGHSVLFDALEDLTDLPAPWHLLVVGDGPLRRPLEQRVLQSKLNLRVIFTGLRSDIPEILAASDVFVFPSLYEGLPNAVLEAMAMGLPIIASDADGIPELVLEGLTGRLVPCGDCDALRSGLVEAIQHPELRRRWGEAGRRRVVEEFSLATMLKELHELYATLLNERCTKSRSCT